MILVVLVVTQVVVAPVVALVDRKGFQRWLAHSSEEAAIRLVAVSKSADVLNPQRNGEMFLFRSRGGCGREGNDQEKAMVSNNRTFESRWHTTRGFVFVACVWS